MHPKDSGSADEPDVRAVEDQVLDRVKDVARRIEERVRRALGDTPPEIDTGPSHGTDQVPPPT
jgi:actin-like ATPase involved in cell morphogenesis